jgi:23S rRNA pseudouridine1911/1915/1917 synthase
MFARTSKAAGRLSAQFRDHSVTKIYRAVVHGHMTPPQGVLKGILARQGTKTIVADAGGEAGQYAELSYTTVETKGEFSLLQIQLVTGRRHQIRAQLAAEGHPIVGDTIYGSPFKFEGNIIALLARSLTCRHPTKPVDVTIDAPLPPDWPWPPEKRFKNM